MTRQNVTRGLREIVTTQCPVCKGQGRVISEESAQIVVERSLGDLLRASDLPVVRVEVHPRMAARLEPGSDMRQRLEARTGRRLVVETAAVDVPLAYVGVVPD